MRRFLGIIIILLFCQAVYPQKRIEVNYITDTKVSADIKYEFELKTVFTVSENGFVSRIRLLNFDEESGDFIIKVSEDSGIRKSLLAGPYIWKIGETTENSTEFELPYAIPVLKDIIYTLSVSQSSQYNNSQKFLNSISAYSAIGNPKIPATKQSVNNLLRDGHFNYAVLVVAYTKLTAGKIGQAQTINFNSQPFRLSQYIMPSGGTGTYEYQWQFSHDSISWTDISGANEASFSPPALTVNTWYRLNVTSGNLNNEASDPILIKVYPQLVACSIGNNQTICYNKIPAALGQVTPPSGGTGSYTYQWQNSPDSRNWSDIAGATFSSYSPPSLTTNNWYRLTITSGYSVTSNVILIEVIPDLIPGTIGSDQSICYNSVPSAFVQLIAPGGGTGVYYYQWQTSTDNISWTNISGANSVTYTPDAITSNSWFRRNTNSGNCESKTSNSIQISILPALTAGSIGTAQSICHGTTPAVLSQVTSPTGGAGSYRYQWQRSPDNNLWSDISGANLAYYSPPVLTATTWFRRNVLSGTCFTVSSNSVQISVHPILVSGTIGDNQSICYNTTPASFFQITPSTGATGSYTYQWQASNDNINWTNIHGASSLVYSPPALTAQTWYRRNVTSGTCGTETSNTVLINVFPPLNPGTIESDQTVCYNSLPDILQQVTGPSGGTGVFTFQWQYSTDNISWMDIENAKNAYYSPSVITVTSWFRRNVTSGCTANSNPIRISIYPPVSSAQLHNSKTIYENTSTTFNLVISGGRDPYIINYSINGHAQPTITNYASGTEISTGILAEGTYRYQLTSVTDAEGCNALSLGTSISISVLKELVASKTNKALVVVNSASSSYPDYITYIKPYLDNFGIPYDVCNVNTTSPSSFNDYALIIFGHKNVYSAGYPITLLEQAVSGGVGLFSLDPHLFDYPSGFNTPIAQRSVSSNQINIPNTTHFITQYHATDAYNSTNNLVSLLKSWTVVQNSNLSAGIDLAVMSAGGQTVPLLQIAKYGNGKVVKWSGSDWIYESILGPVSGMDDLLWRGLIWAARKPFVMQGMPPFITMRVDDVVGAGPGATYSFEWIKICNGYGLIPWCGTFNNYIPKQYIQTLKYLIDNNLATASPHAFYWNDFIYFNHDNIPSFDPVARTRSARDFYIQNGLKISKYFVPHYYEVSSPALPEIYAMGGEFIGIHMYPDNLYYNTTAPTSPWLNCGPFRINRYGINYSTRPVYYGGYINLSGINFFNCVTEIRDDGSYEWFPTDDVTLTTARGIRHLRRALNSMVLATLFTHEYYLEDISPANWREIISQVTSAISDYNPIYTSIDYAVQYVRARNNIKITNVMDNTGNIQISYSGTNDLDTRCYLFNENNDQINNRLVVLPRVNGNNEVTISK